MVIETLHLNVHGLTYGVQVSGDGPPLLLLHGFTGNAATWAPHLPAFAAHFRTICVDLPGHGATDAPADPARYGMAPVVADLLTIVDQVAPQLPHPGYRTQGVPSGLSQPRERRLVGATIGDVPPTRPAPDGSLAGHTPASYSISPSPASPASGYPERGLGSAGFLVLGYSMGGRVALHLALAAPERVRALVLESASPGIVNLTERAARRAADEALAARIERDGLDAFVRYWEALPLFAAQARLLEEARARQRTQRLASNPHGLANSLRGAGAGAQDSLWDRLDRLPMPVLLVTGTLDARYQGIATEMASHLPHAQHASIPNAGHTPHLEQPEAFSATVVPWLLEHAIGCST